MEVQIDGASRLLRSIAMRGGENSAALTIIAAKMEHLEKIAGLAADIVRWTPEKRRHDSKQALISRGLIEEVKKALVDAGYGEKL
jgi:hypothetical protein